MLRAEVVNLLGHYYSRSVLSIPYDLPGLLLQVLRTLDTIIPQASAPLLKWPGGKRILLKKLLPLIPPQYNCYFEPFIGGGAVFFALRPARAVLGDNNPELINCYVQIRDRPEELIQHLATMPNSAEDYYRIRLERPIDEINRAARLIYLTTLSFNGIYRLNRQGDFNVPYGGRAYLKPGEPAKVRQVSAALQTASLHLGDFTTVVEQARSGDVVYLDPPYTVAHNNNGFLRYNARIFSWTDQERLATAAKQLSAEGCTVIVSNANHPSVTGLYKDFECLEVKRPSRIAASSSHRSDITECIFFSGARQ